MGIIVVKQAAIGRGLLALFVLSGVAGLIYQSVWSHYLGLVLGHAAYAQALVLAIYMGGMALGAWLASRYSLRWQRLIVAYAIVELLIGVLGCFFHPLFVAYTDFSQDVVLPHLHSDGLARLWQWISAALTIAPQSVLLGMTFPLMSGGYLRIVPQQDGRVLGGLYFANSIGAAAGALICTFVLLPWIGMPGAVRMAGALNLLVGALALAMALGPIAAQPGREPLIATRALDSAADRTARWLLLAAAVTGGTSFVYEVGWVRLLNQALGTTVHSFELMLSAFILGLALGGWWVRQRSARIEDAVAATGHAQVWMGIAALLSLPMFTQSFSWVAWMMNALARNDAGYDLFNIGSAIIAMGVMLPAAFFAGMTLPLITMALLRKGQGEVSIGRVYAANTLGAIAGVFLTLHILIPTIGVVLSVTLAAAGDLLLGLLLLRYLADVRRWIGYAVSAACGVLALVVSLHYGQPDARMQVAGVFRTGRATVPGERIAFLRDGKTATVSVLAFGQLVGVISTNGKPDASVQLIAGAPPTPDEVTMRMAAALPLAMLSDPHDVAVIGWGSGMTTATLLGSPVPKEVTTIEIERAMYDGARLLGSKVAAGYTDPRSWPRFDDARTYFATGNRQFDVVISEPSNPWVSGVASLFTKEFYGLVRRHLRPGGIMVQWIQSYEIDDRLLATMAAALIQAFPHVDVYITNRADLMFVASDRPLPAVDMSRLAPIAAPLSSVSIRDTADIRVRRIGSERVLRAFANYVGVTPHSDYYPTVSLQGPRARFIGATSNDLQQLVLNGLPVLDILDARQPPDPSRLVDNPDSLFADASLRAWEIAKALRGDDDGVLQMHAPAMADRVRALQQWRGVADPSAATTWFADVSFFAGGTIGLLPAESLHGVWIDPAWIHSDTNLPPPAKAVLAAFDAAARRDVTTLRPRAEAALQALRADPAAPDKLREQMLVLAMLGAIGQGHPHDVAALEQTWGGTIAPSDAYMPVRIFLRAWVDLPPDKK